MPGSLHMGTNEPITGGLAVRVTWGDCGCGIGRIAFCVGPCIVFLLWCGLMDRVMGCDYACGTVVDDGSQRSLLRHAVCDTSD